MASSSTASITAESRDPWCDLCGVGGSVYEVCLRVVSNLEVAWVCVSNDNGSSVCLVFACDALKVVVAPVGDGQGVEQRLVGNTLAVVLDPV